MRIFMILLIALLVIATTGMQAYPAWKRKDYRMLGVQLGIAGLAIVAAFLQIYDLAGTSICALLNRLSPLDQ